jgi:hypothetical protein
MMDVCALLEKGLAKLLSLAKVLVCLIWSWFGAAASQEGSQPQQQEQTPAATSPQELLEGLQDSAVGGTPSTPSVNTSAPTCQGDTPTVCAQTILAQAAWSVHCQWKEVPALFLC